MTEQLHFHFPLSCAGEGNGNPLQCSLLENPRDGGAWWAAVYGVAQSRTRRKWLSSSSSSKCGPWTSRITWKLVTYAHVGPYLGLLSETLGMGPRSLFLKFFQMTRMHTKVWKPWKTFSWRVLFWLGFPDGASGKEPAYQCRKRGFDPWVGKIPWRGAWQPTPVFFPGETHGQKSLAGYSPWGHRELDTNSRNLARAHTCSTGRGMRS